MRTIIGSGKNKKIFFADENQIEVRQNAGDEASPLTCSPECPQVSLTANMVEGIYHISYIIILYVG